MRELHISLEDLDTILAGVDKGFLIADINFCIISCNEAFRTTTGISPNAFEKVSTVLLAAYGQDISAELASINHSTATTEIKLSFPGRANLILTVAPFADGYFMYLKGNTAFGEQNQPVLIDETSLEILINIIEQPIWLLDTECRLVLCNRAFKPWIACFTTIELAIGDSVLDDAYGQSYMNKFKVCYELALSGRNFTTVEDMMVGGELKFTTISFNPVYSSTNVLTGISCFATDITNERKRLSQIEAQTQLLMEIANIQSHKVRGPVATLLGLVEVFNFEEIGDPENMAVMQGVAEVTGRLDEIVKDVIRSINLLSQKTKAGFRP